MKRLIFLLPIVFMTLACSKPVMNEDIPALIVEPDSTSRDVLQHTVAKALQVAEITLTDDALTKDSVLIIDRKNYRTLQQSPVLGRDLGRPEIFRLLLSGGRCVLLRQADGTRWKLENMRCIPVISRSEP